MLNYTMIIENNSNFFDISHALLQIWFNIAIDWKDYTGLKLLGCTEKVIA